MEIVGNFQLLPPQSEIAGLQAEQVAITADISAHLNCAEQEKYWRRDQSVATDSQVSHFAHRGAPRARDANVSSSTSLSVGRS